MRKQQMEKCSSKVDDNSLEPVCLLTQKFEMGFRLGVFIV